MARFGEPILDAQSVLRPAPRWTRIETNAPFSSGAGIFHAGASLALLDGAMRGEPAWIGVFRQRQALAAAVASVRLLRGREDESALRDAQHLTRPHDDPGPSGRVHRSWRWLSSRPRGFGAEAIARLADDLALTIDAAALAADIQLAIAAADHPIAAVATTARAVWRSVDDQRNPAVETLAVMLADAALAEQLGWPICLPLFVTTATQPSLARADGRRIRPPEDDWLGFCAVAVACAATAAHRLALDLARRADQLVAAAQSVRSKGRDAGVAAILADDAVTPVTLGGLGSERAARRFLERLTQLGGVRELTGRPASRIYGL